MKRSKTNNKIYSYQFKLYPNFQEQKLLDNHFFSYNQAYNITIDKLKTFYQNKEKFPSTNILRKEIQIILQTRKIKYNSKIIQFAIDNCKDNYFKYQKPNYKISNKLSPQEKSFITDYQSFKLVQKSKKNSYLTIFKNNIKLILHKEFPEDVFKSKMISVKKDNCNKYYCSINFEIINYKKFKQLNNHKFKINNSICGIDTNKENLTLHIDNMPYGLKSKLNKLHKGNLKSKILSPNDIIKDIITK